MPSRKLTTGSFLKSASLIALLAAWPAGGWSASAQEAAPATIVEAPTGAADGDSIELVADQMTFDEESEVATATGNVLVSNNGYKLRADKVEYSQKTGMVRAYGRVRITGPGGNVMLLDEAELNDDLSEGFIRNVRLMLSDGSRLAASDGQRTGGNRTVLNYAVYSPCTVCATKPDKKPLWQIKAVRITHDEAKKRIYYKNAVLEMFGLPVAYLPFLSHPDPTVERESGFLIPSVSHRQELGFSFSIPYYISFSQASDATITPIITTKEGIVLRGEYRRHLGFGQITTDGSVTYVDERDDNNALTGRRDMRGHLFSEGEFRHGDRWRSVYQFQLSSDDTYLRRYGFSDQDTLTSDYRAEGFYGRSYASIRSLWFQGLRVEDIQGLTGFPLPLMQFDYIGKPGRFGNVLRANVSALALHRTDGQDTRRISARTSWELPYTNSLGQVFKLSGTLRGDMYHVRESARNDLPAFAGRDGAKGRFLPHLTASASWPFMRPGENSYQVIEPLLNLVVARDGGNPVDIPNEDSRTFELTDANIFSDNRFPGLDRWEGGTRLTYGARWGLYSGKFRSEVLVGQSIRFDDSEVIFPDGTGLTGKFSDMVGRWDVSIEGFIDIAHRFRLDKNSFAIRRNEIDATVGGDRHRLTVGYFKLDRDRQAEGLEDREEIRITGEFRIKQNWTFFGNVTQNLTQGRSGVAHGAGLLYRDECLEFSLAWRKSFTQDRDIVPGSSINFRISLKHLG